MKASARTIALVFALAVALAGAVGCGDIAAKVETAENPAPAGQYDGVDVTGRVSLNEKANYAWTVGGASFDAVTTADTEYYVNGASASLRQFEDAADSEGVYEDENMDSFDDTYDIIVEPDGVIAAMNLNMGD